MSNSPLSKTTCYSPNHSGKRTQRIQRVTPHCIVGNFPTETVGNLFSSTVKQASCNYAISETGDVVTVVDECNRSWCTSSNENDQKAVTIECSSDRNPPYTFKNEVYESLADLTVDIIKRNGMKKLIWLETPEKSITYQPSQDECLLTIHRWFDNKACPGDWFVNKIPTFVDYVNEKLGTEKPIIQDINADNLLYTVQTGAYNSEENAIRQSKIINSLGYETWIVLENGLYKIQCGAFRNDNNAHRRKELLEAEGIRCFVKVK